MLTAAVSEESSAPYEAQARPAAPADPAPVAGTGIPARLPHTWLAAGGVAVAAVLVMVLLGVVRNDIAGERGPNTATPGAAPALSIAVLPLANIDGDPAHESFANGLTSDLTTDLSRIPTSFVISHDSARGYNGKQVDARQVGRELGVRYVLEERPAAAGRRARQPAARGHRRRRATLGGAIRGTACRASADAGRHCPAHRPDTRDQAAGGGGRSQRARAHVRSRCTGSADAWLGLWERRRPADNAAARKLFGQALAADANFSLAWVGLANTHLADLHSGWSDDRDSSLHEAEQAMSRAYEIGPRHREVNAGRGYVLFFQGDIELALAAFDREIETNAGNALAHVWRGLMLITLGRPAEALPSIEHAIALSPRDVDLNVFYRSMAHAYFSLGRFDEAVSWSQKAVAHSPKYAKGYAFLAAGAALAGDSTRAADAVEAFRRLQPKYDSVAAFRNAMMRGERRMFDATPQFWEALQKAGLQAG